MVVSELLRPQYPLLTACARRLKNLWKIGW